MLRLLRLLVLLTGIAIILVTLLEFGVFSDNAIATAERQVAVPTEQETTLLRAQVAGLQEQAALRAYLDGDRTMREATLSARASLEQAAGQYQALAPATDDTTRYTALVTQFNSAVAIVMHDFETGEPAAVRGAAARDLAGAATTLTTTHNQLLNQEAGRLQHAQTALTTALTTGRQERFAAAAVGVVLVLLLALIASVRQAQPLIALARQARRAVRAAPQEMSEFTLDRAAPTEVRELTRALNALVAQLREKYLDLEQMNAELHVLNDEARSASESKTAFVASISHELRTPLNAILGFSEMLTGEVYGPLNPKQHAQIERILRNSQQLLALINDVLDISRVESGKVSLHVTHFDAGHLATAVAATMEPLARQKGLLLQVQIAPRLPPLLSDETRLRQVLLNLLSNAIKFTRQGSVTLAVGADPALPHWVIFKVADTGIGIPVVELSRIWQEFYQVSSGLNRAAGGSGLGLAIVRKLVTLLGGDVEVQSKEGQGSIFTVFVPETPSTSRDGASGASLYAATGSYSGPKRD